MIFENPRLPDGKSIFWDSRGSYLVAIEELSEKNYIRSKNFKNWTSQYHFFRSTPRRERDMILAKPSFSCFSWKCQLSSAIIDFHRSGPQTYQFWTKSSIQKARVASFERLQPECSETTFFSRESLIGKSYEVGPWTSRADHGLAAGPVKLQFEYMLNCHPLLLKILKLTWVLH